MGDDPNDQFWKGSYDRYVHQSRENQLVEVLAGDAEKREYPRFNLCNNIIWKSGEFEFSIVDLSVSGIAVDTNRFLEPGSRFIIKLGDLISLKARVVRADEMRPTPDFYGGRFRLSCKFEDDLEAMKFLVLVKDIRNIHIEL